MFNFKKKTKKIGSNKRNLITHFSPRAAISEQYRTIRTNIQFSSVDESIRTILVTSSGPEEGKSTTVANLAVVFAQQGKKVLLIDADLRKPTVHYTFQLDNTTGLTNVLTKQTQLEKAAVTTLVDNLSVLSSGPIPPNPAELLGSKAMEDMLVTALEQYDIVIFDTPPVLAVTDAQILANRCDGTILVVGSGKTQIEPAVKSKELLLSSKGKLLGVVLNRKNAKDSQYYYYYGRN
ncbi:CpsD/CapB family tyrosine-protein kinase [Pseudoneobacillus rhizosphaerae]|uniref:CpsD/CapB family tyrosine-protein kinase n=1 Tax=Pseudoneobacillus rhizosphaerae TaxID=2880968 RepID=UPI001E4E4506|nr:CpsD/CapB family tyrosine-protein kinase [Pseudoneobacillus rhizosphaerae]